LYTKITRPVAAINAGRADDEFGSSDFGRGRRCEDTSKEKGARMSAVNLDDKLAVVLIDLQKGILGLPTAVPPNESRGTACAAPS
jgi:hypothetical protein